MPTLVLGLRSRLLLIVLLAVLPAASSTVAEIVNKRAEAMAGAGAKALAEARRVAAQHVDNLNNVDAMLRVLSNLPLLRPEEAAECNQRLASVVGGEFLTNVVVASLAGTVYCSSVPPKGPLNIADRHYFQGALSSRGVALGKASIGRITGKPVVSMALPVVGGGGGSVGIVMAALDLSRLAGAVANELPSNATLDILDEKGTILFHHPEQSEWVGKQMDSSFVSTILENGTEGATDSPGLDGIGRVQGFKKIVIGDGMLAIAVGFPKAEVLAAANAHLRGDVLWLLAMITLAIVIAWFISDRLVLRSVRELTTASQRIAAHELGARVPVRTRDELGQLAKAFNLMAAQLMRRERESDRESLPEADELLSTIINASPTAIVIIDREGLVAVWNQEAENMFGHAATEVIGRPCPLKRSCPLQSEEGVGDCHSTCPCPTGKVVRAVEATIRNKDGARVEVSLSGAPLHDKAGTTRGAIYLIENVTERNSVTRQLQQAQKMEAIGQLTGGIAHDFNNMLGVIVGNLDLLAPHLTANAEAAELAGTATSAALRAADLTRSLLAFARRQPLKPRLLDVNTLLDSLTRMLRRSLGEQLTINFAPGEDLWPVMVDQAQLESAVTNLAINSRDAMARGGRLIINTRNVVLDQHYAAQNATRPGEYVLIEISDTGSGMAPDVLSHVFEPFFTTKPAGRGTGLGLSMVYGFIRQSGGHAKIYSEAGFGTTVRLYLPRVIESGASVPQPMTAENRLAHGGATVLVVEDNPQLRLIVVQQLASLGYRTLEAEDGRDALAVLETDQPIDLLFTDVVMPKGVSGYDLAKQAGECRPGLKILFTSGFPGAVLDPETREGAGDLLSKPYRKEDLARKIHESLNQ